MADEQRCVALFTRPPWHLHSFRCERRASFEVGGAPCCGTHARVARKWEAQGRLEDMLAYWWKWPKGAE